MKQLTLRCLFLFVSIPLVNSIGYGVSSLLHHPFHTIIAPHQFAEYQKTTFSLVIALAIAIPAIEFLDFKKYISSKMATVLYLVFFVIIALFTYNQFLLRPYEHSLTFISITSILFSRTIIDKRCSKKDSSSVR